MIAPKRKGAGSSRRYIRHVKFQTEARLVLCEIAKFLAQSRVTYPGGPPIRYVGALVDIAEDHGVRRMTAWLLGQRSRLGDRPQDAVLRFMHLAARNVAEHRVVMKLEEVTERRATLLKVAALTRAEAEAEAALGNKDKALELEAEASNIETLSNSLYRQGDPALAANRSYDEDSPEALALGTLRTLTRSMAILHSSPMASVAAAFASAAAGKKVKRDQARGIEASSPCKPGDELALGAPASAVRPQSRLVVARPLKTKAV